MDRSGPLNQRRIADRTTDGLALIPCVETGRYLEHTTLGTGKVGLVRHHEFEEFDESTSLIMAN